MKTKTPDVDINGVFEVKLDDKQKGYLWAKLSPKSKQLIRTAVEEIIGPNLDALDFGELGGPKGTGISQIVAACLLTINGEKSEQRKRLARFMGEVEANNV